MGRLSISTLKGLLKRKKPPGSDSKGGGRVSSASASASVSASASLAAHPTSTSPSLSTPLEVPEPPDTPIAAPVPDSSALAAPVPDSSALAAPVPESSAIASPVPETSDLTSPVPEASTPPIASDAVSAPTSTCDVNVDVDPWKRAYEILEEREEELLDDYTRHLASLQGETSAIADVPAPVLATPRSVQSIVERLLENRDKKQWRISLLGKEVKIREQTERLAKFFLWSDPVIKNALSAQPYAALAWSGVSVLLPLLTSGTVKNEAMLQGFNRICDRQMYWKVCEDDYLKSEHRQHYLRLVDPLAKLYSYMLEYQARVICHLSRAQLSRAWEDIAGWNSWDQMTEFERLDQDCEGYVDHLHKEEIRVCWNDQLQEMQKSWELLHEISSALDEIREQSQTNYTNHMETKLLQYLASDYKGYKDFNPKRVEGTCEWFFNDDRFHTWRDSDTSRLLWVSADPGCGKSVLSRALVDENRLSTNVTTSTVCHFFFKDGDTKRMSSHDALRAILHQLFTQDRTGRLIGYAIPSYTNGMLAKSFSTLWQILVECAESPDAGEIVCILDALDECNEGRNELFENLRGYYLESSSPSKLKFLITSRPYGYLERPFKVFLKDCDVYLRFDGNEKSSHIREEINLVIEERIPTITSGFTEKDSSLVRKHLRSMEHRTYLWLHLTFSIIEENPEEYGRLVDVTGLLDSLPPEVSDVYEKILSRSKQEEQTKALLQIVLAAEQPLDLTEANIALTVALKKARIESVAQLVSQLWPEDNFESVVKNLCGLFISIYDGKLYLIHQTAREFLIQVNPERQGTWEGRLNMEESNSTVSRICLDYLLLPDLETYQQGGSLIWYAATFWPFHYFSQEEKTADESRKSARLLCALTGNQTSWPNEVRRCGGGQVFVYRPENELYLASELGLSLVVEDILAEYKTDVDDRDWTPFSTALSAAARWDNKEIVQILLDHGADVNWGDNSGRTPLSYASVRNGNEAIVLLLLEKGADIESKDNSGRTPLSHASEWGNEGTIELLLKEGVDIESKDNDGRTPLSHAAEYGYEAIVLLLLEKGADIESKDNDGRTPLSHAAEYGYEATVLLLLEKGADIELKDNSGRTPLSYASVGNGNEAIVLLLLEKGADIESKDNDGRTPLSHAAEYGHEATVLLLLEKGANIGLKDNSGRAPLSYAAGSKSEAAVLLLLGKGADIESRDNSGRTPLSHAAVLGDVGAVEWLLKKGADIQSKDNSGQTPLSWAARYRHRYYVKELLEKAVGHQVEG